MASSSLDQLVTDLTAPKVFTAEEIQAALAQAIKLGWTQHGEGGIAIPISEMDMEAVLQAAWEQSGRWTRVANMLIEARTEVQALTANQRRLESEIHQLKRERDELRDEEDLRRVVEIFLEWLQTWHSGLLVGFDAYSEIKRRVDG